MVRVALGLVYRLRVEPGSLWRADSLGDVSEFLVGPDTVVLRAILGRLSDGRVAGGSPGVVSAFDVALSSGESVEYF